MPLKFCCSKHFDTDEVLGDICQSGPQAPPGCVPGQAKLSLRNHPSGREHKDRLCHLMGCKQRSFRGHKLVSVRTKTPKRLRTSTLEIPRLSRERMASVRPSGLDLT